ncbi:MAG: site-specific integrase [Parabacteroides sp.]|nr:site-specific integrase [Parabacteroides sp.]
MKQYDFVKGMRRYIARLREQGRYSSAKSYQDALNSFRRFCGREVIPYTCMDKEMLLGYQDYLLDREYSWNTVSTYMRRIRRVYGVAMENGEAPFSRYLFKGIFMGVKSKQKKALPEESLRLLMTAPVEDAGLRDTQRALCLMFLFCGMAFVDFAHLKKSDIQGDVLKYNRQKTGTPMLVEVQLVAKELMAVLMAGTRQDSPYLFAFLSGTETGEGAFREYTSALACFNRSLKELAKACGVAETVTSYSIRHSFATTLKEQGVPIEMISELLGHQSIKTTQIYLKSFSVDKMSAVNKACFESIYNNVSKVG